MDAFRTVSPLKTSETSNVNTTSAVFSRVPTFWLRRPNWDALQIGVVAPSLLLTAYLLLLPVQPFGNPAYQPSLPCVNPVRSLKSPLTTCKPPGTAAPRPRTAAADSVIHFRAWNPEMEIRPLQEKILGWMCVCM